MPTTCYWITGARPKDLPSFVVLFSYCHDSTHLICFDCFPFKSYVVVLGLVFLVTGDLYGQKGTKNPIMKYPRPNSSSNGPYLAHRTRPDFTVNRISLETLETVKQCVNSFSLFLNLLGQALCFPINFRNHQPFFLNPISNLPWYNLAAAFNYVPSSQSNSFPCAHTCFATTTANELVFENAESLRQVCVLSSR